MGDSQEGQQKWGDNSKNAGKTAKIGIIRGHQASHDFWVAKLQSAPGADNPRYAAIKSLMVFDDCIIW